MTGPIGRNTAEDAFVARLMPRAAQFSVGTKRPSDGVLYAREAYHNETRQGFARRLSRMGRTERLIAKAIRSTLKAGKVTWERKWTSEDQTLTWTADPCMPFNQVRLSSRKWREWR